MRLPINDHSNLAYLGPISHCLARTYKVIQGQ